MKTIKESIINAIKGHYQSNKRRFIEGLLGYSASLAFALFLLTSVVLPIPVTTSQGFDAVKPIILHVLALATIPVLFSIYGKSITTIIHTFDEIPIRYIKYLIRTRKNLRDLK